MNQNITISPNTSTNDTTPVSTTYYAMNTSSPTPTYPRTSYPTSSPITIPSAVCFRGMSKI